MKKQSCFSLLTMIVFFFATTTQSIRAADLTAIDQAAVVANNPIHSISQTELHQSIQSSQKQASAAQKCIQNFLDRSDVQAEIQRLGVNIEKAKSQVALLTDTELLKINQQIMRVDLQKDAAGAWRGTKWVIMGVVLLIAVILLANTINEASNV